MAVPVMPSERLEQRKTHAHASSSLGGLTADGDLAHVIGGELARNRGVRNGVAYRVLAYPRQHPMGLHRDQQSILILF